MFFPVYCEEENLKELIPAALAVLAELPVKDYEVIIVNDGSTDQSAAVAEEFARQNPRVRVIHHPRNLGYGAALQSGYRTARMEYVFYADGDNQYDLNELKKFVALLPWTDIVTGFRIRKQYSAWRKFVSFVYNLTVRLLFGLTERDIDCAFKLFPRRLFDEIEVESKSAFIDAEIALKARALGYRTTEVGVTNRPRCRGRSSAARPMAILKVIQEMARHYRRYPSHRRP